MTLEQQGFEALKRAQNLVDLGKKLIGRHDGPIQRVRLLESIATNPNENKAWHVRHASSEHAVVATMNSAVAYLLADKLIELHQPPCAWGKCNYYRVTKAGEKYLAETMELMTKILRSDDYLALAGTSKPKKKGENHECSRACSR